LPRLPGVAGVPGVTSRDAPRARGGGRHDLLAPPTADAADIAELTGLEVYAAEDLLVRLEATGAISPLGRA